MMKIEIWYEVKTVHGEDIRESRIVRIPPNIKQINSRTCLKIMRDWLYRANSIIQHLDIQHTIRRRFNNHCIYMISSIKIKGWSLVIDVDVLEFICSRL